MKYELTKSKYCKGVQCPKILWLDENMPEMAENTASESVLETLVYGACRELFK